MLHYNTGNVKSLLSTADTMKGAVLIMHLIYCNLFIMYNIITYSDFVAITQNKDYKSESVSLWGHS